MLKIYNIKLSYYFANENNQLFSTDIRNSFQGKFEKTFKEVRLFTNPENFLTEREGRVTPSHSEPVNF